MWHTIGNNSRIQEITQSLFCESFNHEIRCNQCNGNNLSSGNKFEWFEIVWFTDLSVPHNLSDCFHSCIFILVSMGNGLNVVKYTFIHNTFIHLMPHNPHMPKLSHT